MTMRDTYSPLRTDPALNQSISRKASPGQDQDRCCVNSSGTRLLGWPRAEGEGAGRMSKRPEKVREGEKGGLFQDTCGPSSRGVQGMK